MIANCVILTAQDESTFVSELQNKIAELEANTLGQVEVQFSTALDHKTLMYSALLIVRVED